MKAKKTQYKTPEKERSKNAEYYRKHKEDLIAKAKTQKKCLVCGAIIASRNKKQHEKTKKHRDLLEILSFKGIKLEPKWKVLDPGEAKLRLGTPSLEEPDKIKKEKQSFDSGLRPSMEEKIKRMEEKIKKERDHLIFVEDILHKKV